jgi:hypothetical protein
MRTWVQRIRAISPWIAPAMGLTLATTTATVRAAAQAAPTSQAAPVTQAAPAAQAAPAGQADPAKAADQAKDVLAQVRAAQGGDKVATIKSLSAEGSSRITFGEREITNDIQLKIVLPNHFQRITQPEMPNGMPGPRIATTVNGTDAWAAPLDPMPNFGGGPDGGGGGRRGGGQGGGMIMMGGAMMGGPNAPNAAPRIRADLLRTVIGILPGSDALEGVTYSYVGTAQSKDGGEADILAVKAEGLDAKLFIDKKTHLPLMVTFQGPDTSRMRQMFQGPGGPGGPGAPPPPGGGAAQGGPPGGNPNETPEERQKRMEEARKRFESLPQVEHQLYYADYKKVDGVLLPHRFTRSVNGNPAEELEIKKYKINPKIDLNDFQKKGS